MTATGEAKASIHRAKVTRRWREGTFEFITFHAPEIGRSARAGQFLQVLPRTAQGEFFLPRPMSILDASEAEVSFAFKVFGYGTARLKEIVVDDLIQVLGPVGKPWPLPAPGGKVAILAGGVGFPPLYFLARTLIEKGWHPEDIVYFFGARTAGDIGGLDRIRDLGVDLRVSTDDGTEGFHGNCVRACETLLDDDDGTGWSLHACGPTAMLQSAVQLGTRIGSSVQVSLETPMACGVGVCVGCMTPRRCSDSGSGGRKYATVCADGPVFDGAELDWSVIAREHASVPRPPEPVPDEEPVDISVQIGTCRMANPVVVASGTFGYGSEYHGVIDVGEIGGVITKSVSEKPRIGNPPPRIREVPGGMLNAIGLQNVGVEAFLEEKLPFFEDLATRLIVNVVGHDPDEYLRVLDRLAGQPRIDAIELNLSCPNVEGGMRFSSDPGVLSEFVGQARERCEYPLIVKLTPNVTDVAVVARAAEDAGADAVSLVNTLVGLAIDLDRRRSWLANVTGGYSGPAIKPVALAQTWQVASAVGIPVLGGGGIMTASDACEFHVAGASAISVGTATFVDPVVPIRVARGIEDWLRSQGCRSLKEVVGTLSVNAYGAVD